MIDAAMHVAADTINVHAAVQMKWMEWMDVGAPVDAVDVDELPVASQVVNMRRQYIKKHPNRDLDRRLSKLDTSDPNQSRIWKVF